MSVLARSHLFSKRELEIINLLKEVEIKEAAERLEVTRGTIYSYLNRIRDKIETARNTVNMANNWLDSGKNQRLGKLLRRQG